LEDFRGLSDGTALSCLLEEVSLAKSGTAVKAKVKAAEGAGSLAIKLDNLTNCFAEMETLGIRTTGTLTLHISAPSGGDCGTVVEPGLIPVLVPIVGVNPSDIMESHMKHTVCSNCTYATPRYCVALHSRLIT
jgi:hypothetical protein